MMMKSAFPALCRYSVFLLSALWVVLNSGSLYAQTARKVSPVGSARDVNPFFTLKWKAPAKMLMPDGSSLKLLEFSGAIYPKVFSGMPVYTGRHYFSISPAGLKIEILNPIFQVLTDEEMACISVSQIGLIKSFLEPDYTINKTVGKTRVEVFFLPFRKNAVNGSIEKLISFSVRVTPSGIEPERLQQKSRSVYASSSFLKEGT
jgi:hypothetical protein